MIGETNVVHSYLWWCQVTPRSNDIQYTAADMRQVGFWDSEAIDVKEISQLSRAGLVWVVKTNVQITNDVHWVTASHSLENLRHIVEECGRDSLRTRSIDHDDDEGKSPQHHPSAQQLERSRINIQLHQRQTNSRNRDNRHAAMVSR